MGIRKLTRWQKASALVPLTLLVGVWGAMLTNSEFATATDRSDDVKVPSVPSTPYEQPASVQPTPPGVDPSASAAKTVSTLSTNGIPAAALAAYRRSENLLGRADPSCKLSWSLVAAIGRVESNHGRTGGNALNGKGVALPGIFGPMLDGKNGTARIQDTDAGALDNDAVYDRAVGPMQFIPSTWQTVGVDADNDGHKNPQDIDDSATSTGIYLCAGEGDLSTPSGAATAVRRYNHSDSYVDLVLKIAAAYAKGDFVESPNGVTAGPLSASPVNDRTLTPGDRKAEAGSKGGSRNTSKSPGSTESPKAPSTPKPPKAPSTPKAPATPEPTKSTPDTGGGSGGGHGSTGGVSDLVGGVVSDGTGTTDPDKGGSTGSATLTWAEAKAKCLATGLYTLDVGGLLKCVTDLLS